MDIAAQKVGMDCVQGVTWRIPKGSSEPMAIGRQWHPDLTRIANGEHYRDVLGIRSLKHQEATILRLWRSLTQRRQAALLQTLLRNARVADGGD